MRFNDMKLRSKIVIAYILFLMLPIVLVGLYVVREYREAALTKAIEQTENAVERVKTRTEETLLIANDLSARLMVDTDLERIATMKFTNVSDIVDAYRDYDAFKTYLSFNPEVAQIQLYIDNPTLLNNGEFVPLDEETEKSFWFQEAMKNKGLIGWYYLPDSLSLVRTIHFRENQSYGLLDIDVDTEYLSSILMQEDAETILLDSRGVAFASNRPNIVGKRLDDTFLGPNLSQKEPGTYELTVNGVRSKVIVDQFYPNNSFTDLKIVSIFSVDSIVEEANRINEVGMEVISLFAILSVLIVYLICTVVTNRLRRFSRQINKVSIGNFNADLSVNGGDEIGQISRQFNQMVANIKELMEELKLSHQHSNELERKQSEIKLKMLANQVNPHFLYNALESIRMKAHLRGEKDIANIVKMLGKLLRKSLEITGREISLREEIEMVRYYLEIQKFRHEERLTYEIHVAPEAEDVMLLPLLIQPLVENSVIHGLERSFEGGWVKVSAELSRGGLQVVVEDNGVGIPAGKLKAILRSLADQESTRIGLHNVQQRLLLTYGSVSGLRIESEQHSGTRIAFWIPVEEG
ncbi:sensor histidine kinase [Cohnella lubricantis]|uniref:histidine kinase n=1 Tax=Cohnella lubricantis TaxID=2163172 RepID=A0A841THT6_9BACL|nr:sensor histidine kinase [Cohnella lubricantis]MBB6678800.1 sensor histidine kinase [Cohnella lubricantis]MBP2119476.1 two-component system sensor histidine kinase YesM [Cohnella lubricantis]